MTNQRCPCPLGTAAANDFQCTADPSTFLPFKAFTNSLSPCRRRAKQGSQRSGFTPTTVRAELTGRAPESIDANHRETSTKNDTGSACETLGYAWGPLQPNREIPWSIEQRVECKLRQERQRSQKKATWENKRAHYISQTSPQCCRTELAQLTCCQSMKVIIPSETKRIIKMQILGALRNSKWMMNYLS